MKFNIKHLGFKKTSIIILIILISILLYLNAMNRNGEMILELKFDGITKIDNDSFILKKSRYGRRIAYKVIDV